MEQTAGDRKTILVVDDDPGVLNLVSYVLGDAYNVVIANNGQEALLELKNLSGEIYMLLCDFQMPGITGIDLARQINGQRPSIKVLLMSGLSKGMLYLTRDGIFCKNRSAPPSCFHWLPAWFRRAQLPTGCSAARCWMEAPSVKPR